MADLEVLKGLQQKIWKVCIIYENTLYFYDITLHVINWLFSISFLCCVHYTIMKQINPLYLFLLSVCWSLSLVLINSSIPLLWSLDKGKVERNSQIHSNFATG